MVEHSELSEFYVFVGVGVFKNPIIWHKKWHVTFIALSIMTLIIPLHFMVPISCLTRDLFP